MCFLPTAFAGYAPALPCTETNYSIQLESPQSTGFCLFTLYFITSNHEHFLKDELLAGWRLEPNRQAQEWWTRRKTRITRSQTNRLVCKFGTSCIWFPGLLSSACFHESLFFCCCGCWLFLGLKQTRFAMSSGPVPLGPAAPLCSSPAENFAEPVGSAYFVQLPH